MAAKPIESIGGRGPIRVVRDVGAPLNDVRRHIDSGHFPAVRPGTLGAINRDAGADFEQTINDEFH
jgi:hypothetical protein